MINFHRVSKQYPPDTTALHEITFSIGAGEMIAIVGTSGAGKTTLIRLLIAEERPTSGTISIADWDIGKIHRKDVPLLRRQIGVVFQDFKLLPQRTAAENVAFALEVVGTDTPTIKKIVPEVLSIVGLDKKHELFPHQLSGGEQQRVVIARALAHRPKILIADEPTGNLDPDNAEEIMRLLKKINEFNTTVLLVTHNLEAVRRLKSRVLRLHEGKLIGDHPHLTNA